MGKSSKAFLEERETQTYEEFMSFPQKKPSPKTWEESFEAWKTTQKIILKNQSEALRYEREIKSQFLVMQDLKDAYGNPVQINQAQINTLFKCNERWFYFDPFGKYCFSSQKDKGKTAGKHNNLVRIKNPFYQEIKK